MQALLERLVRESARSTASCIQASNLLEKHGGLLAASAFALNLYTMDSRQIVSTTPKHVNFFCEYVQPVASSASRMKV